MAAASFFPFCKTVPNRGMRQKYHLSCDKIDTFEKKVTDRFPCTSHTKFASHGRRKFTMYKVQGRSAPRQWEKVGFFHESLPRTPSSHTTWPG